MRAWTLLVVVMAHAIIWWQRAAPDASQKKSGMSRALRSYCVSGIVPHDYYLNVDAESSYKPNAWSHHRRDAVYEHLWQQVSMFWRLQTKLVSVSDVLKQKMRRATKDDYSRTIKEGTRVSAEQARVSKQLGFVDWLTFDLVFTVLFSKESSGDCLFKRIPEQKRRSVDLHFNGSS
jgi:hypothetical protein